MRSVRAVLASLLLVGALVPVSGSGKAEQPVAGLVGNFVQHPTPAPDFTLTDQHDQPFHMADARGKVVLMSFIYTHCTDLCPFIAVKVKAAYQLLGSDASRVEFVAVTTDPKRDVPSVMAAYSKAVGLNDVWHFVGGAPRDVQAVWSDYGIGVTVDKDTSAVAAPEGEQKDEPEPTQGLSKADQELAEQIAASFGGGYDVGHSAPFWFVDTKGRIQAGMDADATPTDIAANIRTLLKAR